MTYFFNIRISHSDETNTIELIGETRIHRYGYYGTKIILIRNRSNATKEMSFYIRYNCTITRNYEPTYSTGSWLIYLKKRPEIQIKIEKKPIMKKNSQFSQLVKDKKTNSTKRICYNLIGKFENHIDIIEMNDKNKKLSIIGRFLDHTNLNSIKISTNTDKLIITNYGLFLNDASFFTWSDLMNKNSLINYKQFKIEGNDKILSIIINFQNQLQQNSINFNIKKLFDGNKQQYFDIDVSYKNYQFENAKLDGIIGKIQNKQFIFNQKSQDESVININGKNYESTLVNRIDENCWSLSLNDILDENKIDQFVYVN